MKTTKQIVRKYYKYVDTPWTQPILTGNTSSSEMVVSASSVNASNTPAWKVFDNNNSTQWISFNNTPNGNIYVTFNKTRYISSITVVGWRNAYCYLGSCAIYSDNSATQLIGESKSFYSSTGGDTQLSQTWTFNTAVPVDYLNFKCNGGGCVGIDEIHINGFERTIIPGTSSDYDFYRDVDEYKVPVISGTYYGVSKQ